MIFSKDFLAFFSYSFNKLVSIAIHWNSSLCTTSHIEDFISIIDPFICLHEVDRRKETIYHWNRSIIILICILQLFSDVTIKKTHPINQQQRTLIGLVCFYSRTIEVFFSYESRQSQWYFCLDGNLTIIKNWVDVQRKCLEFHLQPFLLIYANSNDIYIDRTQLLQRTIVQHKSNSKRKIQREEIDCIMNTIVYSVYTITIIDLAW